MRTYFCLGFFFINSAFATTFSPKELSALAESRAPLIRMQIENQSAASRQISQSRTLGNPLLTFQTGSIKSSTQSGSVMDISLNQPFPWPGKRQAAIESSEALRRIADVDLEEAKLLINHTVTLLSLEYASLVELEKHHDDRRKRFSLLHKYLNSRPMASPKQIIEKNLIETQIKLVENYMNELVARKTTNLHQLKVLTGEQDISVKVYWDKIQQPLELNEYARFMENNPQLKRSNGLKAYAENRAEEAKFQAKPDILLGVNYRQENLAPVNHFYHAQVSVVIPILDHGQHSVEIARANVRKEEANYKLVSQETTNLLNAHYQELLAAHRSTVIFKISEVNKSEARFKDVENAFRLGRIDAMTFLQSETQAHESIDLAYTSYTKYYNSMAQIMNLTGQKLEL